MRRRTCLDSIIPYSAGKKESKTIKLSSNENPLGPSPKAVDAFKGSLSDLNRYPDGASSELRNGLGEFLNLSPSRIIIGNGSDEILFFLAGAYINPGENGITAQHTFSEYAYSLTVFGGEVRKAPLSSGAFDLQSVLDMADEKTRLFFLCNPNNPTGRIFPESDLVTFLEKAGENRLVVVDEAYHEYCDDPRYPDTIRLIEKYPQLFVTRTFSKIYGLAGLRVGYGFGHETVVDDLMRMKQAFNVNLPAQRAAAAALTDSDFRNRSIEMVRKGKRQLAAAMDSMDIPFFPTESNFICIETKDAARFYRFAADLGITIRDLNSFDLPLHIRYTISTEADNAMFISILGKAKEAGLC